MRHEFRLSSGHRCGFFLGDGAGVGKGRQIAGQVYEHHRCGTVSIDSLWSFYQLETRKNGDMTKG